MLCFKDNFSIIDLEMLIVFGITTLKDYGTCRASIESLGAGVPVIAKTEHY